MHNTLIAYKYAQYMPNPNPIRGYVGEAGSRLIVADFDTV